MADLQVKLIDNSGVTTPKLDLWPSVIIPKAQIEAEIERLAGLPAPENGRRSALVVHPLAEAPGLGLAPGIQVSINELKPGERTKPIRHNSTQVNFCIRGRGHSIINGKRITFELQDVWNTPSMAVYSHVNDSDKLQVRLTYSNAALLEKMNAHIVEEDPPVVDSVSPPTKPDKEQNENAVNPFGTFSISDDGAHLMPYEKLINPDMVPSTPLHWQWKVVKEHLDKLQALGKSYIGRRLYLLFNPATGRTNGTTHNFFATMCLRPPGIVDRPHRHTAAAINYYFSGKGYSVVEGKRFEWQAGDLMLSAPGWAVHNHASYDEPVYELTIQDSPLNIAMESLLWQENMKQPLAKLGSQEGFATNRANVSA